MTLLRDLRHALRLLRRTPGFHGGRRPRPGARHRRQRRRVLGREHAGPPAAARTHRSGGRRLQPRALEARLTTATSPIPPTPIFATAATCSKASWRTPSRRSASAKAMRSSRRSPRSSRRTISRRSGCRSRPDARSRSTRSGPGRGAPVAIASYAVWRKTGLSPSFIGSTVRVNGTPVTVVGVTAARLHRHHGLVSPQWWFPLGELRHHRQRDVQAARPPALTDRGNYAVNIAGVLKPGVDRVRGGTGARRVRQTAGRGVRRHRSRSDVSARRRCRAWASARSRRPRSATGRLFRAADADGGAGAGGGLPQPRQSAARARSRPPQGDRDPAGAGQRPRAHRAAAAGRRVDAGGARCGGRPRRRLVVDARARRVACRARCRSASMSSSNRRGGWRWRPSRWPSSAPRSLRSDLR